MFYVQFLSTFYKHLYSPKLVAIQQTNYKHKTMKKGKKQLD